MQKRFSGNQIKYTTGVAVTCALIAIFLYIFMGLAKTDKTDVYISGFGEEDYGWRYEILAEGRVMEAAPQTGEDGLIHFPMEPVQAIRITRVMTEEIPDAEIELNRSPGRATEVYLDDLLLYSDCWEGERNKEGFLIQDENMRQNVVVRREADTYMGRARFSLPGHYTGCELKITTYFLNDDFIEYIPNYPYLGSGVSRYAPEVADTVMPVAVLVLCAVCVLLLNLVFWLDTPNGRRNWKILLPAAYFIFLFVNRRYESVLGDINGMEGWPQLLFSSELFFILLCLYLVLLLTGWRKWLALGGMLLWIAYEGVCTYRNIQGGMMLYGDWSGCGSFAFILFFAAVFLAEHFAARGRGKNGKRGLLYVLVAVFVAVICIVFACNRSYDGNFVGYLQTTFWLITNGYFGTVVAVVENTCAAMVVFVLVAEFLRRNAETKAMVAALEEREKAAMTSYDRMLKAERSVNSAHHEMRHHMTALMALIKAGEMERAGDYLSSVEEELERMPAFQYSRNMLVNVIAGTYLDQAKEQGIRVECTISVPETLRIADEDMSVFLSNMLQNAVEACGRMEAGAERFIRLKMYQRDSLLFIGCVNSVSASEAYRGQGAAGREHGKHGYGLKAMSRIAEKYGSILKIDQPKGQFSVMSSLYLDAGD